jgi:hypothetical protein
MIFRFLNKHSHVDHKWFVNVEMKLSAQTGMDVQFQFFRIVSWQKITNNIHA